MQARILKIILSIREATHIDNPARNQRKRDFVNFLTMRNVLISTFWLIKYAITPDRKIEKVGRNKAFICVCPALYRSLSVVYG